MPRSTLLFAAACSLCVSVTACMAQLAPATAGHVGCAPEEIVVSNPVIAAGVRAWQASCRGRSYECSWAGNSIACTELKPPATGVVTPPPPVIVEE